jgi:PAS domain S-box-containing protein
VNSAHSGRGPKSALGRTPGATGVLDGPEAVALGGEGRAEVHGRPKRGLVGPAGPAGPALPDAPATTDGADLAQAIQVALTRAFAASESLAETAPDLVRIVCERFAWPYGEVWLANPGRPVRAGSWSSGDAARSVPGLDALRLDPNPDHLTQELLATPAPTWLGDLDRRLLDDRLCRAGRAGFQGALVVPFTGRAKVIGVMLLFSPGAAPAQLPIVALVDIGHRIGMFVERMMIEEAHAILTSALEQTAESILVTTTDGIVVFVNAALERISGYSRSDIVGRTPRIMRGGRHDASFYEDMWRRLRSGEAWQGVLVNRRADGALYEIEATISPVRDPSGQIAYFVEVARDATHERELEAQLRQIQKMDAIGRLAGGIAHDFNNIVTVIGGYAELLEGSIEDEGMRADLAQVQAAARRAASLTRQLLAFSRHQMLQARVIDLREVVAGLEPMLRRLIGEDVELRIELSPEPAVALADPNQLGQVLMNLVVNARDAMPTGGQVTITAAPVTLDDAFVQGHLGARPGRHAMIAVEDNGVGMDEATRSRVFEPFFTTKDPGKGTGLGLATVYGIVKQSGGNVWVESAPGAGTTILVHLPHVEGPVTRPVRASGRPSASGTETILLVEDNLALRRLTARMLGRHGYEVLEAQDGRAALRLARAHTGPIHLLITDVVMPKMNGPMVAERLTVIRPDTRVMFMSGYADSTSVHLGLIQPGVAILDKPFSEDDLVTAVRSALDTPPGTVPGVSPGSGTWRPQQGI